MCNTPRKHVDSSLKSGQQGFSLVEILVTVVIIAVGLLGTAALNLVSLRNNTTALIRTQASALAGDITDRMRANHPIAVAQGYNATTPADPQALLDVTEWRALLAQALPNGTGTITVAAPAGGTTIATIVISWSERDAGTAGAVATQTFTTVTEI
jgi:type IV pilus assembly protein PilV